MGVRLYDEYQGPGRTIDMVKAMAEMILSRYVLKRARNELNEEAHRQVSGSEFHNRGGE